MTMYREMLRLRDDGHLSQRDIAASCGCSHSTVKRVLARAENLGLSFESVRDKTDEQIMGLLYPVKLHTSIQHEPDYAEVHRELPKSGVTMALLWNEYCDSCKANGWVPYMYSQFCKRYREYVAEKKLSWHAAHKPGEVMEVDWAGTKMSYTDEATDNDIKVSVFVAVLPFSGYTYAEAFHDEKQSSWVQAHINAYWFFGGVTRLLRPDNLKTGVRKADKYEPEINTVYREMAEHYGTYVSPARILKPKDKATVEGTVGIITTNVIAALRNRHFSSLAEINNAIKERMVIFNKTPFQKKEGSRESVFLEEEQSALLELPEYEYQMAEYKEVTIQNNYHVYTDGTYYSVPFCYAGRKATIRLTRTMVEVFCKGERIASHIRNYNSNERYITETEHMPQSHRYMAEWDGNRFRAWAARYGRNTLDVINGYLESGVSEQNSCRRCMGLLQLSRKHSAVQIEAACAKTLSFSKQPSLKSIKLALQLTPASAQQCASTDRNVKQTRAGTGTKAATLPCKEDQLKNKASAGFRRGAEYFGGTGND